MVKENIVLSRDPEERGRQAELMKDIFLAAAEAIVWLGEETDDSDIGIRPSSKQSGFHDNQLNSNIHDAALAVFSENRV